MPGVIARGCQDGEEDECGGEAGDATRAYLQSRARDIWTAGDGTATGFGLPTAP